jgi:hypothetical protein
MFNELLYPHIQNSLKYSFFALGTIWVILRRNVIYLYSKKPYLHQLFNCQKCRT